MLDIKPIASALFQQKTRALLIIFQVAITLAIVSNSLHIISERYTFVNQKSGAKESEVVVLTMTHISDTGDLEQQYLADQNLLRANPSVLDVSITGMIPYGQNSISSEFHTEDLESENPSRKSVGAGVFLTSDNFIQSIGAQMLEGRSFKSEEIRWGGPSDVNMPVMVTKGFADSAFENESAVGKIIYDSRNIPLTIIGVVKKLHNAYLHDSAVDSSVFIPYVPSTIERYFVIRTESDNVENIRENVANWLLEINPDRIIQGIHTLDELRGYAYNDDVGMIKVLAIIIIMLLIITGLAIVGMTSFSVSQRTKQIGTRRALGATRFNIVRYFVVESSLLSVAGIFIGVLLALLLNSELINQFSLQPITFQYLLVTITGIIVLSFIAVIFPALKASEVSPAIATRTV